jgi:hypothetical protein
MPCCVTHLPCISSCTTIPTNCIDKSKHTLLADHYLRCHEPAAYRPNVTAVDGLPVYYSAA